MTTPKQIDDAIAARNTAHIALRDTFLEKQANPRGRALKKKFEDAMLEASRKDGDLYALYNGK